MGKLRWAAHEMLILAVAVVQDCYLYCEAKAEERNRRDDIC